MENFPRIHTLDEIEKMMIESNGELEHFKYRITFMSMDNDIVWGEKGNTDKM